MDELVIPDEPQHEEYDNSSVLDVEPDYDAEEVDENE